MDLWFIGLISNGGFAFVSLMASMVDELLDLRVIGLLFLYEFLGLWVFRLIGLSVYRLLGLADIGLHLFSFV